MRIIRALVIYLTFLLGTACTPAQIQPPQTQLQIRALQTRTYMSKDLKLVMKAVINALQDDGFIIKGADKELGFITASKEMDVQDSSEVFWSQFFQGAAARYKKNSVIEASANVTEFGKETKVRIIFQAKIIDNFGAPVNAKQIEDAKTYQEFFTKVDKSVFIEKSKL